MESFRKLVSRFRPESEKSGRGGKMTVNAVITRADGTVEDLGKIAEGFIKDFKAEDIIPSGGNNGNSSN